MSGIVGIPEWSPGHTLRERRVVETIRTTFEAHGFQPLDTGCITPRELLYTGGAQYSDGGLAKPVFSLSEDGPDGVTGPLPDAADLALRYDLTVPLARYIGDNLADVTFPLHCYQLGKVWRAGEVDARHWREFYQFDIDIIGDCELGPLAEAEVATAMVAAFSAVPELRSLEFSMHFSHRGIIAALAAAHGIDQARTSGLVAIIDDWSGDPDGLASELVASGVPPAAADDLGELVRCTDIPSIRAHLQRCGAATTGVDDLEVVLDLAVAVGLPPERIRVDPSITRGHDYYTGTVFEVFAEGRPAWGAIASGGRYASLLSSFVGRPLPGVGVSIGLTRLSGLLRDDPAVADPPAVADLLLAYADLADLRAASGGLAAGLRAGSVAVQVLTAAADLAAACDYGQRIRARAVLWVPAGGGDIVTLVTDGRERTVGVTEVLSHI